jgi:ABC-type sugar transport system permease subunit
VTSLAQRTGRVRRKRRSRAGRRGAWLLTAPAVVVMLAVSGYPVLYGV